MRSVLAPVEIMGHECRVTASIGIAMYPDDARDAQTLMKHADMAMYLAKEEGKNNFQFYSTHIEPDVGRAARARDAPVARARARANSRCSTSRKSTCAPARSRGAEALLRWWNPELGAISPDAVHSGRRGFGLIVPIGKWVLKTACEQNVAWQRRGLRPIVMSVNMSPRQFKDAALLDDIAAVLAETGMAPELLELEITESMIMHNVDIAADKADSDARSSACGSRSTISARATRRCRSSSASRSTR